VQITDLKCMYKLADECNDQALNHVILSIPGHYLYVRSKSHCYQK
jgi:hypothetical protein